MSRTVLMSPEVAALVGPEQAARMRGPAWSQRIQCFECGGWIEAHQDTALSVLRVLDPAAPADAGGVSHGVQHHPGCAPSRVVDLTPEELARHLADPHAVQPATDDTDVLLTVGGIHTGPFPLVLVSYRSDLMVERPGGDRVDVLTSSYLAQGWHPVLSLADPPGPAPSGYRLRFTHESPDEDAPGLVEILGRDGTVETAAVVEPMILWRPLARRHRRVAVVHGTNYLADGPEGLDRAVRSGLLVGGRVPVDLAGPGNPDERTAPET